jgi:methylenetetrahydrofolate dehydrogenase (NADP+)/methenyltetrahydrofolate cyclohydrolase
VKNNCTIIDGKNIAESLLEYVSDRVVHLKKSFNITPGLAVIQAGNNEASNIYVRNKMLSAQKVGINTFPNLLPEDVTTNELISIIESLNNKLEVHGILVQLPLPKQVDSDLVLNAINPEKDVDGFTYVNVGRLYSGVNGLESCTPQGAMMLIKHVLGNDLSGKKAVVLGRSRIVGRPMVAMLIRENCTVTVAHSYSINIEAEVKSADILVSAVGVPNFVKGEWLKEGCCVIDVGIIRLENKLYGDVDFESASKVAGYITPVPGGVGPMTVACLMKNTLKACCQISGIHI